MSEIPTLEEVRQTDAPDELSNAIWLLPAWKLAQPQTGIGIRAMTYAAQAAMLATLFVLPWTSPWSLALTPWLLLLPALVLSSAFVLVESSLLQSWRVWRMRLDAPSRGAPEKCLFLGVFGTLLGVGFLLSNVLMVDHPVDPATLLGYAVTLAVSGVGTVVAAAAIRRTRLHADLGVRSWRGSIALLMLYVGGVLSILDALAYMRSYRIIHLISEVVILTLFVGVAGLGSDRLPARARGAGRLIVAAFLVGSVIVYAVGPRAKIHSEVFRTPGIGSRALEAARRLTDRDGDGYSAMLGGGDCDDTNASAYPLSLTGRDCTGWSGTEPQPPSATPSASPSVAATEAVPDARPKLIVLITIDAFRCGFNGAERDELRDACPNLARVSREGRFHANAHTLYPSTMLAIESIQTGSPPGAIASEPPLAARLSSLGYHTHAISTHRRLFGNQAVKRAFDTIDSTLVPIAREPTTITSEAVTDRVLAQLREVETTGRPTFVWAHYYDPHSPYVERPDSHLSLAPVKAYAAEVRRTDVAIGRLVEALRASPVASQSLVLVTADHGEALGEHGTFFHGLDLYEPVVRIPIVVWSPGLDHRAFGGESLPNASDEIAGYLLQAVTGVPFVPRRDTFISLNGPRGRQVGIIVDGWKLIYHLRQNDVELYDLARDPDERNNLALDEPERVRSLGTRLFRSYRGLRPLASDE
jgi:hypothetical protein